MTVQLPRRFVVAALSAAVCALVVGVLVLSGTGADGPVDALAAGTATTLSLRAPKTVPEPSTTVTHAWPGTLVPVPSTTVVAPPPTAAPEVPAAPSGGAPPPTTAAASPPPSTVPPATTAAPPTSVLAVPEAPAPVVVAPPGTDAEVAARIVADHNRERAARGLPPLQRSTCLDGVALTWAAHLATLGRLVHNHGASGAAAACLAWRVLGENLGWDGAVETLEQAWMASAVHQANILDPRFTHIGVGVVRSAGSLFVVVNFAG